MGEKVKCLIHIIPQKKLYMGFRAKCWEKIILGVISIILEC